MIRVIFLLFSFCTEKAPNQLKGKTMFLLSADMVVEWAIKKYILFKNVFATIPHTYKRSPTHIHTHDENRLTATVSREVVLTYATYFISTTFVRTLFITKEEVWSIHKTFDLVILPVYTQKCA